MGALYAWRVRACDESDCGEWGETRYLNVGRTIDDINGDGFGDTVLEGRYGDVIRPADGLVFIAGKPDADDLSIALELDLSAEEISWEHARFVGDLNGDGFADLSFGTYDTYKTSEGSSDWPETIPYVVYGAAEWAALKAIGISHLDINLTSQPYHAGDVNGDGLSDLLLGDSTRGSGAFRLVSGGAALSEVLDEGPFWYANGAGDLSGDGLVDIVTCDVEGGSEKTWIRSVQGSPIELAIDCARPWPGGDFNQDNVDDLVLVDGDIVSVHLSPTAVTADWLWDSDEYNVHPVPFAKLGSASEASLVFVSESARVLTFSKPLTSSPSASFTSALVRGFANASDLDGDGTPELASANDEGAYWTRTGNLFATSTPLPMPSSFEVTGIVTQ